MIMDCKQFATTKLIIMYCKSAAHAVFSFGAMVACLQGLIGSDDIMMSSLEVELVTLANINFVISCIATQLIIIYHFPMSLIIND